jgi:hypothetical protein
MIRRTAALVDKIIAWTIGLPRNFCSLLSLTINVAETGMLTRLVAPLPRVSLFESLRVRRILPCWLVYVNLGVYLDSTTISWLFVQFVTMEGNCMHEKRYNLHIYQLNGNLQ